MRTFFTSILILSCLLSLSKQTLILPDSVPQYYQIAQGQYMIVFDEDEDQRPEEQGYVPHQVNINPEPIGPETHKDEAPPAAPQGTRFHTTTSSYSYYERTEVRRVKMFSSFGSLGHRSDETQYRELVREKNMKWIQEKSFSSGMTFTMGQNQFSTLTVDEFRQLFLNLIVPDFVPDFELDFKKEIQKFIKADEKFMNKFFNMDINWPQQNDQMFDFDKKSDQPVPVSPSKKEQDQTFNPDLTPQDYFDIIPKDSDKVPSDTPSQSEKNMLPEDLIPDKASSESKNEKTNDKISENDPVGPVSPVKPVKPVEPVEPVKPVEPVSPVSPVIPTDSQEKSAISIPTEIVLPDSIILDIDWVREGYVSKIKDQGSCGGCYSFAAHATVESLYLIKDSKKYKDVDLSEQQIIDCSGAQGNKGCNGGWMPLVYTYSIKYGITTESDYPYLQYASSCKKNSGDFKISSYKGGALPNCTALSVMVTGRPVAIAVSAGNEYWQNYAGGIMNKCGNGAVDHGVVLVGVYEDKTENYWKVKNSWGTTWGENGYIRLDRSIQNGNICNICSYGFYPEL